MHSSAEPIVRRWKPRKWIALPLAFILAPVGFLYLGQPLLALLYLLLAFILQSMLILADGEGVLTQLVTLAPLLLMVAAAAHAFFIVRRWTSPSSRPWFSRGTSLLILVVTYVAVVVLLRAFIVEPFRMPATSMQPSIPMKSIIIVEKWGFGHYGTYGFQLSSRPISRPLRRGDVLVFDYPLSPDRQFVKRLVGLPGEKISYRDKRLAINGREILTQPAEPISERDQVGSGETRYLTWQEFMEAGAHAVQAREDRPPLIGPIREFAGRERCEYDDRGFVCTIPDGHYFVMGDNRDNSDDSRYWGFVPEHMIVGKVITVISPITWGR